MVNKAWTKKYSPKIYTEQLLPAKSGIRSLVKEIFDGTYDTYKGILLYGKGGTGKTTFAKTLANHTGWDVYELEESGETKKSLDTIKTVISTIPYNHKGDQFGGSKHLIVGNEISESSLSFRNGLRAIIDKSVDTFFVFTDNNYDKLLSENPQVFGDERILCLCWNDLIDTEILGMCERILKSEGKYSAPNMVIASTLIKRHYPSVRQIIEKLQENT